MRKVHLHMQISADGLSAGPNGELDWLFANASDDVEAYNGELYTNAGMVMMGRMTYQQMAEYWPKAVSDFKVSSQDREGARRMNELPKVIFSRTLEQVGWQNCRLVKDNLAEAVAALKREPGGEIILSGGATIARSFMQLGLIDEFHLLVHPILLGAGKPLFGELTGRVVLELVESRSFSTGVVLLHYLRT
jgi:dihydrofolate reductase